MVFVVGLVQGRFPWPGRAEVLELPDGLVRDRPSPAGDFRLPGGAAALLRRDDAGPRTRSILTSARDYGGPERAQGEPVRPGGPQSLARRRPAREGDGAGGPAGVRAPPPRRGPSREAPLGPDVALDLSHRQVDDYQTCPLKYRYVHVLRVPIRRHHTVVYGETLHRVVEHYLRRRAASLYTPLEDLLADVRPRVAERGVPHVGARGRAAGRRPGGHRALLARGGGLGHAAHLRRARVRREPARSRRTHPGSRPVGPRRRDRGRSR